MTSSDENIKNGSANLDSDPADTPAGHPVQREILHFKSKVRFGRNVHIGTGHRSQRNGVQLDR